MDQNNMTPDTEATRPASLLNMLNAVKQDTRTVMPIGSGRKELERINARVAEFGFQPRTRTSLLRRGERPNHRALDFMESTNVSKALSALIPVTASGADPAKVDTYKKEAEARAKSLFDLLSRRSRIVAALVKAQALAGTVVVGTEKLSIAEALAIREDFESSSTARIKMMTHALALADAAVSGLKDQADAAIKRMRADNLALALSIKKGMLTATYPNITDSEVESTFRVFIEDRITAEAEKYKAELHDVYNIRQRLVKETEERDQFILAIDAALDAANVSVMIEV
jgi:hypothetical protein